MEPTIEHNAPRGTQQKKDEPSGGALKALQIVIEIRRARQTIESQLKDIKSAAKSKIAALKKAEAVLLDTNDPDDDQMTLFDIEPVMQPEVRDIIDNPEI